MIKKANLRVGFFVKIYTECLIHVTNTELDPGGRDGTNFKIQTYLAQTER